MNPVNVAPLPTRRTPAEPVLHHTSFQAHADQIEIVHRGGNEYTITFGTTVYAYVDTAALNALLAGLVKNLDQQSLIDHVTSLVDEYEIEVPR